MKGCIKAVVIGLALCVGLEAQALTITSMVGGVPEVGANYVTFDGLIPGSAGSGVSVTEPNGAVTLFFEGNSHVAQGGLVGKYAPPILSDGQGAMFGQPDGPNTTPYLATGTSSIKILFGSNQEYLGFLWGSVDGHNYLDFYDEWDTLLGTVSGDDVGTGPYTRYVNVNSSTPFRYVVARSEGFTLEIDNVAYRSHRVADGGLTAGLLGASVLGLLGLARKRRRHAGL